MDTWTPRVSLPRGSQAKSQFTNSFPLVSPSLDTSLTHCQFLSFKTSSQYSTENSLYSIFDKTNRNVILYELEQEKFNHSVYFCLPSLFCNSSGFVKELYFLPFSISSQKKAEKSTNTKKASK